MNKLKQNKQSNNNILDNDKLNRNAKLKRIIITILLSILSSFLLVVFILNWQKSYDLLAYTNAFYFSGFIFFFIGWMILMTNMNILSPVVYGLKTFFLMFAAKKPKIDYYSYTQERIENPIPRYIVLTPFIVAIPNFIIAIILHISL